jgi:phospholipid/cholesterol/gamma-HCH transport system substrate-binding protein
MRKLGSEIAVGIVIFSAFVVFVSGYLYLKNVSLKTNRTFITIHFKDVTGLEKSDFVSVAGLRIGRVQNLKLDKLAVLAEVRIDPGIEIPIDSRAQIKSLGMVGEKFIDIVPGNAEQMLQDGDSIEGHNSGDLSDLSGSIETLFQQAQQLIDELRTVLHTVLDNDTQHHLKETVFHLRNISSDLDNNSAHIDKILVNLDSVSGNLNEILAARREKVESSIDNIHRASTRLDDFANKLDTSLASVQSLLTKMENQDGTLGKVINSDEMYNDLRHLTAELDTLVQDLQRRPQKYLNLGFIKVF